MELSSVTKMPPQRLLLIVGGGIAAGLLWRKFSGKSSVASSALATDAADGSLQYPGDLNGYPMDTVGNRREYFGSTFPTVKDGSISPDELEEWLKDEAGGGSPDPNPGTPVRWIDEPMDESSGNAVKFNPNDPDHWSLLKPDQWEYVVSQGYTPPAGAHRQA